MRLNAIAAERAETIATTIQVNRQSRPGMWTPLSRQARSAPVSANGSANTECSNLIMSSVSRSRVQKRASASWDDTILTYVAVMVHRPKFMDPQQVQRL